jgi:anti-sigma factor RsiW
MKIGTPPVFAAKTVASLFSGPACEEFSWLLAEYWEGEADASLRTEIEDHARSCPQCAEVFRSYQLTIRTCRATPRITEPEDIHRKLWQELAREIEALKEYLK